MSAVTDPFFSPESTRGKVPPDRSPPPASPCRPGSLAAPLLRSSPHWQLPRSPHPRSPDLARSMRFGGARAGWQGTVGGGQALLPGGQWDSAHIIICSVEGVGCAGTAEVRLVWT